MVVLCPPLSLCPSSALGNRSGNKFPHLFSPQSSLTGGPGGRTKTVKGTPTPTPPTRTTLTDSWRERRRRRRCLPVACALSLHLPAPKPFPGSLGGRAGRTAEELSRRRRRLRYHRRSYWEESVGRRRRVFLPLPAQLSQLHCEAVAGFVADRRRRRRRRRRIEQPRNRMQTAAEGNLLEFSIIVPNVMTF